MEWVHFVKKENYTDTYLSSLKNPKVCTWNQWRRIQKQLDVQKDDILLVLNHKMKYIRMANPEEKHCTYILKSTSDLNHPALKNQLHSGDHVCILALSFEADVKNQADWDRLYQKQKGMEYEEHIRCFRKFGIQEDQIEWVAYFSDSKEEIQAKIERSNVLMLTGGNPVLMMKRIKELRLKPFLKNYQGVMIGYSAGAMVLLDCYHMDDSFYAGIGCLSGFDIEVHYEGQKAEQQRMQKIREEKHINVYGITDQGGIQINEGQMTFFGNVECGKMSS